MLKIRLRRMGNRNRPFYRVVVSDSRKTPISSALEEVGHYDPTRGMESATLEVDRIQQWVDKGAQMSPTVAKLVRHQKATAA
ncbi:MAG: 30S ribosomal protein S16 [bacterium]|nr:30S ribosomal protein S16 [bacterium]